MKINHLWKSGILTWEEGETLCISVVFTWWLPKARQYAEAMGHRPVRIGGPAVELAKHTLPGFFLGVNAEIGGEIPGVLQRFNPKATRTSIGCPRKCTFCSVPLVTAQLAMKMTGGESPIVPLRDWPDLPVICDDNLLFTPLTHFDKVCDRLERWGWCDFNQGIDARKLTDYHAERIARIKRPMVRLALDSKSLFAQWESAFDKLRKAGIAKRNIRAYCIIADASTGKTCTTPDECWEICGFVEKHGVKPLPMWFHGLNALERNKVTPLQAQYGWTDYQRKKLFQWYYQHKEAVMS